MSYANYVTNMCFNSRRAAEIRANNGIDKETAKHEELRKREKN